HRACVMPVEEKRSRMKLLRDIVRTYNVQGWAESFLSVAVIADPRADREGGTSPGEEPGMPLIASATAHDPRIAYTPAFRPRQALGSIQTVSQGLPCVFLPEPSRVSVFALILPPNTCSLGNSSSHKSRERDHLDHRRTGCNRRQALPQARCFESFE